MNSKKTYNNLLTDYNILLKDLKSEFIELYGNIDISFINLAPNVKTSLNIKGYKDIKSIVNADTYELYKISGVGKVNLAKLINSINTLARYNIISPLN
tara:strand:- start:156 stop:449 length:294 start_codon:yes stop_codon:yes gene_type:complete